MIRKLNLTKQTDGEKVNFFYLSCGLCGLIFRWIPVIIIWSSIIWSFYVYTFIFCLEEIKENEIKLIFIFIFNYLIVMTFWSYYQCMFTLPSKIPDEFKLTDDDIIIINNEKNIIEQNKIIENIIKKRNLIIFTRTSEQLYRICNICNIIKPDRGHHCSVCNICIVKMDHHCVWVNNCINLSNYKYFLLLLTYSFLTSLWSLIISLKYLFIFLQNELVFPRNKRNLLYFSFASIIFVSAVCPLFIFHLYLLLKNRTTLEQFKTPIFFYGEDTNAYDLGKIDNLKQVFGSNCFRWFFPIPNSS